MKKALIALTAFLLSACGRQTPAESKLFEKTGYTVSDEISNQQVNTFAEDGFGHIWIGTFRGLNKFNVFEIQQFYTSDDTVGLTNNQIKCIFNDSKKRMWIGTVNGVNYMTPQYTIRQVPFHQENKNVIQLLETRSGKILANGTTQLAAYTPEHPEFETVIREFDPDQTFYQFCHLDSKDVLWAVSTICVRSFNTEHFGLIDSIPSRHLVLASLLRENGDLWMAGQGNISILDTRTKQFKEVSPTLTSDPLLSKSSIEQMYAYDETKLLFVTANNGLFLYDTRTDELLHERDSHFPFEAPHFKISTVFRDSQKNLWFGSNDQGYTVRYHYKDQFNSNHFLRTALSHKSVVALKGDRANRLWISTLIDGLFVCDLTHQKLENVPLTHFFPSSETGKIKVTKLLVDTDNSLWLVFGGQSTVMHCEYANGRLVEIERYPVYLPMSVTQDELGTVWIGTASEAVYYHEKGSKEMNRLPLFPKSYTFIPSLLPDGWGHLLVGAFNHPIQVVDIRTKTATTLPVSDEDVKTSLPRASFVPTAFLKNSRGEIWIGTVANGLLHYSPFTGKLRPIDGEPCEDISGLEEDAQGNLWVSTMNGLGKYDHTVNKFTNYYKADGIGGNQFLDRSSCKLPDGTLAFGGTHGLTIFNPIDIAQKRTVPLLFEDLKIYNQRIIPGPDAPIQQALVLRPEIRLKHDQNSFSISYTALDYGEFERTHYYYKMDGVDKYWVDARNNHEAIYANLPAGKYTFRVRISNNNRSIIEAENTLQLVVEPSPWRTWWAYLIYVMAAASVLFAIIRGWLSIRAEKQLARQAELEKEQEKRVNKMNMSFFANISHEFRTPLTMISGPVEQLCESPQITGEEKRLLYILQRNVSRMLRLVNQLLDFNKLENDTLKLHVTRSDLAGHLLKVTEIFQINANERKLNLRTVGLEEPFTTWYDEDKVDKIIINLYSNALKYTPAGGDITLDFDVVSKEKAVETTRLSDTDTYTHYAKIVVSDTGPGIPTDKLEKIFDRYYQLDKQSEGSYNWGTGIGLYYARSLARLHHGYLTASNRHEGTGSVFTLLFPISENAYSDEEKDLHEETQPLVFPLRKGMESLLEPVAEEGQDKQTLFVVDDDTEVLSYLEALLSPRYRMVTFYNAETALKSMQEELPELVVSDVVMPGKDGYWLCNEIKQDLQLCHIPVILLTAKVMVENQVEGLSLGADAYVTKPFEPRYLLALIKSQLDNRAKIHKLLNNATETNELDESVLSPQDNVFMNELYHLMETELSNPELDIIRMTEILKISRTKFYYKVKGLTGENPSVFFKHYKLNKAAKLIKDGTYTMSEIADMTGFSTLSHFSTSFKKQFGVPPSEYK